MQELNAATSGVRREFPEARVDAVVKSIRHTLEVFLLTDAEGTKLEKPVLVFQTQQRKLFAKYAQWRSESISAIATAAKAKVAELGGK